MAPRQQQEDSPLIGHDRHHQDGIKKLELANQSSDFIGDINAAVPRSSKPCARLMLEKAAIVAFSALGVFAGVHAIRYYQIKMGHLVPTGPYRLVQSQEGNDFFSFYDFYAGPDSLGSAGFNMYVSKDKAEELDIAGVKTETDPRTGEDEVFVYMSSAPTKNGPRDSVRLEGKKRFDRGLFILDVRHMPTGCGIWPAFWMTDEAAWPRNGEIDVLEGMSRLVAIICIAVLADTFVFFLYHCVYRFEGVNGQTTAKTALHTSDQVSSCSLQPVQCYSADPSVFLSSCPMRHHSAICMHMCLPMPKLVTGSGSVSFVSRSGRSMLRLLFSIIHSPRYSLPMQPASRTVSFVSRSGHSVFAGTSLTRYSPAHVCQPSLVNRTFKRTKPLITVG